MVLPRHLARALATAWLAGLLVACGGGGDDGGGGAGAEKLRVLFIGNSLTEMNALPQVVRAVSEAAGGPAFAVRMEAEPGFSLEDHLVAGSVGLSLQQGTWDFVVLQQGPSSLAGSRALLRRDVAVFADRIRAGGAEPAVYQVWPEGSRRHAFPAVIESYRLAAEDISAPLLPAGQAWLEAWALDPGLPLYGDDGFHPSHHGTYLAALVIYEGLTGRSAVGIPGALTVPGVGRLHISDAEAATLQRAAEAVRQRAMLRRR